MDGDAPAVGARSSSRGPTAERLLSAGALALALLAFFGLYATRIWDIDFWWHAATGRLIVATHALPDGDPFGIYTATGPRPIAILKGYWLMQALLYAALEHAGTRGVIALRALFLSATLLVLHRRSVRLGAHPAAAALVLALAGATLLGFTGERPQLASFLLSGIVFLLLDRYDVERRVAYLLPLPVVMLLWANCHGGVVLGAALLALFSAAHAVERWRAWSSGLGRERVAYVAVVAASLLATLASPAGWSSFVAAIAVEGSELASRTSEYQSPLRLWRDFGVAAVYPWALVLALAAVVLVRTLRERRWARAAVITALGILSARTFRYVPFFVVVAGPYVAAGLTRLATAVLPSRVRVHAVVAAAAAVALGWGLRTGATFQDGVVEGVFPVEAAAVLASARPHGKVLTSVGWGGYLLWTLPPSARVFIDGRNLEPARFAQYTHMIWATPYGMAAFENERFDYVLMPRANLFTGEEYALNDRLRRDPRWRIVQEDAGGFLFARAPAP